MAHTHDRTLLASLGFQDPDRGERRHTLACQYLSDPERGAVLLKLARPGWFADDPDMTMALKLDRLPALSSSSEHHIPAAPARHVATTSMVTDGDRYRPVRRFRSVQRGCCESAVRRGTFLVGFWDVEYHFDLNVFRVEWTWEEDPEVFEQWLAWKQAKHAAHATLAKRWNALMAKNDQDGGEDPFGEAEDAPPLEPAVKRRWQEPVTAVSKVQDIETRGILRVEVKIGRCDAAVIARQIETYRTGNDRNREYVEVAAVAWQMDDGDKQMLRDQGITVVRLGRPFEEWCAVRAQREPTPDVEV